MDTIAETIQAAGAQQAAHRPFGPAALFLAQVPNAAPSSSLQTVWREVQPAAGTPEELQIAALKSAVNEACDQLQGWVNWKCPKKHIAEHEANIARLREIAQ